MDEEGKREQGKEGRKKKQITESCTRMENREEKEGLKGEGGRREGRRGMRWKEKEKGKRDYNLVASSMFLCRCLRDISPKPLSQLPYSAHFLKKTKSFFF